MNRMTEPIVSQAPDSILSSAIECTFEGPMARVTINNPDKLGAMNRAMWRELRRVFEALQDYKPLRAVLISGAGAHFCAGGDISEYPGFRFEVDSLRHFHEVEVWGGLSAMLACDAPIVAAIEGACMGAGMEIASCCDVRVASTTASFGAPIARLGFPMAPREAQLVAREAGLLTVREMLLEAAVFSPAEMKARGFLNEVVEEDRAYGRALERVQRLCRLAPQAARRHKQMLRQLASPAAESDALQNLVSTAYDYAAEREHREGIDAFIAKRRAEFD